MKQDQGKGRKPRIGDVGKAYLEAVERKQAEQGTKAAKAMRAMAGGR